MYLTYNIITVRFAKSGANCRKIATNFHLTFSTPFIEISIGISMKSLEISIEISMAWWKKHENSCKFMKIVIGFSSFRIFVQAKSTLFKKNKNIFYPYLRSDKSLTIFWSFLFFQKFAFSHPCAIFKGRAGRALGFGL